MKTTNLSAKEAYRLAEQGYILVDSEGDPIPMGSRHDGSIGPIYVSSDYEPYTIVTEVH